MVSNPSSPEAAVAIITVSYGSAAVLPAFLASIPRSTTRPAQVVVADNRAADASVVELVESAGFGYLPMVKNLGYGGAINAAVATLPPSIDWLVVANPDVTIHPDAIDVLIEQALSNERIALVGPRIVNEDGVIYPSARSIPSLRTGVGHALFANIWPANPWSAAYHNDQSESLRARTAGWLSGSFFLARRTAFEALGGFDEHYFMYFEDVDLGYRLGKAGWLCVYEPSATVVHTGAHSTSSDSGTMAREHHISARKFLARKYAGWALWPVRMALRAGLAVRLAIVRIRSRRSGNSVH